MNDAGFENLSVAILQQAIKDYICALRHCNGIEIYRIEQFFKSDYGELLSENNGEYIISECKKRAGQR